MASTFPTTVDNFTDPTSASTLASVDHAVLHQDVNDAIEKTETKLGTGPTTPSSGAVLVGTGAGTSEWDTSPGNLTFDTPTLNTPDLNGTELILDADADTSITADTDDQIDIKINGADDFRLTANTLTALAGSSIATDTISETTATAGVTIDGVLLKDSKMNGSYITDSTVDSTQLALGVPVQMVSTNYSAVATGTTVIPLDDTIPQNTEGTEFMTQAITPKSTTNVLVIEVVASCAHSGAAENIIGAIFQDSVANALAANTAVQLTADGSMIITVRGTMTAGTTSSTTFKFRGGSNAAGTLTFNGRSAGRLFGAITKSSITITEYKA